MALSAAKIDGLRVEVIYLPTDGEVDATQLVLSAGMTIEDAITRAAVLTRHPEIRFPVFGVGRWGKSVPLNQEVRDGDRIEIYPPLVIAPMAARRLRAQRQRKR